MLTPLRRLLAAFRRRRLEAELNEEIRDHLARRAEQLVAAGMDPGDARREAGRLFGNAALVREDSRALWGFAPLDTIAQDVRYALRTLRRAPGFAAAAILSLGAGIGATTAVFTLADAYLFRTLPVPAPEELVIFRWSGPDGMFDSLWGYMDGSGDALTSTSFPLAAFESMRRDLAADADVFGFADMDRVNLSIDGRPEIGSAQAVSGNYYQALGLTPASGRLIAPHDDRPDAAPAAVISYDYWRRRFSAAPIAGRPIVVNGIPLTIVGVEPEGFHGTLQVGEAPDVIVPLSAYGPLMRTEDPADPGRWWVLMMARLKARDAAARVQRDAGLIFARTVAAHRPTLAAPPRVAVEPGSRGQVERRASLAEPLRAMALVVAALLLVACANVANLLLARGTARTRELSIRLAIGAARQRIVRQLLTESLVLAACGAALGLLLAHWLAAALAPAVASGAPPLATGAGDPRVLLFTIALAAVSTVLFGVLPAWRATSVRLARGLRETSRAFAPRTRLSGALVVCQVALTMVLVTAAGMLVTTIRNLRQVDPGFDADRLLIFRIDPSQNGYDMAARRNFYAAAVERLRALPGAERVSFSSHTLLSNSASIQAARPAGTPAPAPGTAEAREFTWRNLTWRLIVGDGFLETAGIPLLRGRTLGPRDSEDAQPAVVINEKLAARLFGAEDPIGRSLVFGTDPDEPEFVVVGIAADAKYTSIRDDAPPTAYLSYRQYQIGPATFAVRTAGAPGRLANAIRDAMREIDPLLPVHTIETQQARIEAQLESERVFAALATILGAITLLLASTGLYGLLAYTVNARAAEIGVRLALGAAPGTIRWMILRVSLALVLAGIAIGVVAAVAGSRYIESMLYGVTAIDPAAFGAAAAVLLSVSLAASLLPARRASRVDPVAVIRGE